MTDFTFEIKGVTLDMCDMQRVHENYEIYCTAEYLMDNYELTYERAKQLACGVRHIMNKYGYDEETAIDEVLRQEEPKLMEEN